jgi:hypothetical protein
VENERNFNKKSDAVYSFRLKAGRRRTYFFDVRTTKQNDYYLTITESKKRPDDSYEKHKIFLYKEDFNKFVAALNDTVNHVKTELLPDYNFDQFERNENHENHDEHVSDEHNFNKLETEAPRDDNFNRPETPSTSDEDLKW